MISNPPPGLMTQAQYAEHRKKEKLDGVTRQAVNKKVKTGQIPTHIVEGVAYIDPQEADAAWEANNSRPTPARPGAEQGREVRNDGQARELTTWHKVRIQSEGYSALKKKIELERLEGTVLPKKIVENELSRAMRIVRDQLRGMPSKLSLPLAHAQTPQQVTAILNAELKEIMVELARKFIEALDAGRNTSPGDQPTA